MSLDARITPAPNSTNGTLTDVPAGFAPLRFGHWCIGAVSPGWIHRLDPLIFRLTLIDARPEVHLIPVDGRETAPATRSLDERLQRWAWQLRQDGLLPGWRNERVAIFGTDAAAPLFHVERGLLRPLGLLLRTVQVNVHVLSDRGRLHIWTARRAATKAVDPGRIDSLVAGGISADESPAATLLREAAEEAAIPEAIARQARPVAIMDSCHLDQEAHDQVLHRERMHIYDLRVSPAFRPRHPDGEVSESALLPAKAVLKQIHGGLWTSEGAWASVNLIHRAGKAGPVSPGPAGSDPA